MKPSTSLLAAALALTPTLARPCSPPPAVWTVEVSLADEPVDTSGDAMGGAPGGWGWLIGLLAFTRRRR